VEGAPKPLAKALAKLPERAVGDGGEGTTARGVELERVSCRERVIFLYKKKGTTAIVTTVVRIRYEFIQLL
jgi:hypothetical protein